MIRNRALVFLAVLVLAPAARAGEAGKEDALVSPVSLVGTWQLLAGHEKDDVAADPAKFEGWAAGEVPGRFADPKAACTWYQKRFLLPPAAKGLDAEIVFERALWHGEVWLNGKKLGGWTDGYAPFRLLATAALKFGDENVLVARAGGRAEAPKAKCGHLLVPAGFGEGGGGPGGILGAVTLRFFNKVRITRAQVLPDLAARTARVSLRLEGAADTADVDVAVLAPGAGSGTPAFKDIFTVKPVGSVKAAIKLANGAGEATVPVGLADVKPWSPASPFLYDLEVVARCAGQPADRVTDHFGMREVSFRRDGFYLNGEKTRLLGANIMGEMAAWRSNNPLDGAGAKSGLIEPARRINANCIRTHAGPLPAAWLDACDEAGLMVLLEFGVTVNCAKIDFTAEELAEFKRNLELQAAGVVPALANHPSVIMWVMTNESNNWPEYERGPLWQLFKKLDPSRPAIRASYDTPEVFDVHSYHGMWKGCSGDFDLNARAKAETARAQKLPWMITEYLEGLGDLRRQRKWFGPDVDSTDPKVIARVGELARDFHAQRAMEQTECSRRLDYCGILPFGPGFWQGAGGLSPTGQAVASALAPVGLSIDLFNQHFEAGADLETELWVTNDTGERVAGKIRCALLGADPGFDHAAALPKPLFKGEVEVEAGARAVARQRFTWKLPKAEGQYWLVARLERPLTAPVMSRRPILVFERRKAPKELAGRKLLVVESDGKFSAWAAGLGCRVLAAGKSAPAEADLVVVAPGAAAGEDFKKLAPELGNYLRGGGRVLVLEQLDWPAKLKDPFNVQIERTDYDPDPKTGDAYGGSSRVWRWEQPERAFWRDLPDNGLWRWNGCQGRVARVSLAARPDRARILARYAESDREDLKQVPVAAVAHGKGELLYFMLQTEGRYRREDPNFDPAVERLMINLLGDWKEAK